MSWFEDLFINEAKPALNGRPSSGGSSEGGNSSGGNSGPCSWNDLTDKPFGEETGALVKTLSYDAQFATCPSDWKWAATIPSPVEPTEGKKYKIVTRYEQTIVEVTAVCTLTVLGGIIKSFYVGDSTSDKIYARYSAGKWYINWESATQVLLWRVEIYEEGSIIRPIDEKYLPDSVVTEDEFDRRIAEIPSSEGGAAIIDVVELPTENIREDAFYRLLTGTFVFARQRLGGLTCYCVGGLPEIGEPVTTDMVNLTVYYDTKDGSVNAYVDSMLSAGTGLPVGWHPFEVIAAYSDAEFGGVITDIMDDPVDSITRLLLEYELYYYKDGWTLQKSIGLTGSAVGAEIFNYAGNEASGEHSHAEGQNTTASGEHSHAEGQNTTASGGCSHAEGQNTTASGYASHAEGHSTTASNGHSHAEGQNTTASGYASHAEGHSATASGSYSHAEGYGTTATRAYQHVQGLFNAIDNKGENETSRGRYAHIVGNGEPDSLSNAHTLDWDGNAWFAGGIELTSPNGTRYRFTVSDDGTLSAVVVTE